MMLWIKGCLTPQEIRNRLEQKDSQFQQAMIAYLESTHQGGYIDTTASDISVKMATTESEVKGTPNPTLTLPIAPPKDCSKHNEPQILCQACMSMKQWQDQYKETTNELLFRCNRHTCHP
ncbi:hypothetical protein DENSPDRAFT_750603, partial [Dentipellis sp. KUC8613]